MAADYHARVPYDLKLIDFAGASVFGATWPNPAIVAGEYNLVQRVVINLLTDQGDDEQDPDWGSGLGSSVRGIPGQDVTRARAAVSRALAKCRSDIINALGQSSDPAERLVELSLTTLDYDFERAAWVCSVTLTNELSAQINVDLALG